MAIVFLVFFDAFNSEISEFGQRFSVISDLPGSNAKQHSDSALFLVMLCCGLTSCFRCSKCLMRNQGASSPGDVIVPAAWCLERE